MLNLKALAISASLGTVSLAGSASAFAPAGDVKVKSIQYNGSGCPLGTVSQNISSDKQAFTLTFAEYIAEAGPDFRLSDGRKNCQLTLTLQVPQGWQFSIGSFDYRGFLFADEGMMAEHNTSYYFQGSGFTGRFRERLNGPIYEDYHFRENVGIESLVWSPCGVERALNVNTAISVRNTNKYDFPYSEAVMGTDSIDGQIRQVWGISWRRCR
ncbi:DUF4360 domain-containing protein [Pseudobacteriovorax antillogorgiicola]|uniref:DUF4360 domain-containing protein n=1 Tax=Pseudobacteriovorax antillogorgiicola TaxID=1513793 RepID=A0A1Y6BT72_9BACT|nr:DUF4360 domain-containing protein [Pseudobacteriovorax antillogorgiicola]TCS54516.1 uncharacterized protein DUF4360 [Pseudobacteriovorax antillogorgiicola]SMF18906.1 protein of unknown function [Pseudobacteriovorax antillogorgiicola]